MRSGLGVVALRLGLEGVVALGLGLEGDGCCVLVCEVRSALHVYEWSCLVEWWCGECEWRRACEGGAAAGVGCAGVAESEGLSRMACVWAW